MKRLHFLFVLLLPALFYACQSVNVIPIDYLTPAEVNFPEEIRRIGVINNVADTAGRVPHKDGLDSILLKASNGFIERYILNGDAAITAESLAESIASENYFDEVVICDSVLNTAGTPKKELTENEVNRLTNSLEVDMLVSLEEIQFAVQRQAHPLGEMGFLGTVATKVYPKVNLYIPNRSTPLVMIHGNDSIFWEDIATSKLSARTQVIPDKELIAEASDFAGTVPVKYMTPSWKTANRYFFPGGSPEMRDAAHFFQQNDPDRALTFWQQAFDKLKGRKKAHAASNISLYYELKDDMDKAYEWGQKALELAHPADSEQIKHNQTDVEKRRADFMKLKIQMARFDNDFGRD